MQRKPASAPAPALSDDLEELRDLWSALPEAIRAGMLATTRALALDFARKAVARE